MSELTELMRAYGDRTDLVRFDLMDKAADRIEALEAGLDRASVLLESEGNYVEAQAARALLEKR